MRARGVVWLAATLLVYVVASPATRADQARLDELLRTSGELQRVNKIEEAIDAAKKALAHAEQLYGPRHAEVARALDQLATLYRRQSRYVEAKPFEERSRAIKSADRVKTSLSPAPKSAPPPGSPAASVAPSAAAPRSVSPPVAAVPAPLVVGAPAPAPSKPSEPTQKLDPAAFAEVPVFFGTNRAQGAAQMRNGVSLASFTSTPASTLTLGKAVVSVPRQGREKGEIPRPRADSFWRAKETEDPRFHFMLLSIVPGTREVFIREVNELMLRSSGAFKDQAFVFVHGFNVPFEDAVFRTAQISYDLDFSGAAFLYSWPTLEGAFGYVGARDRALASRAYLRQFLDLVSRQTSAKRIHLIAHSMGTWPLLDVLREIAVSDAADKRDPRFQEVILVAPDMDRDNFIALSQQICPERSQGTRCAGGSARGMTVYASNNDRALLASVRIAAGIDRAGLFDESRPFVVKHVDTIDVSGADTSFFSYNHSQPLERSLLLKDIGLLLDQGQRPPHQRYPVYEPRKTSEGGEYWRFQQKP